MSSAVTWPFSSTAGITSSSAPSARINCSRSLVKQSEMTIRVRYPFARQTSASAGPVLPPVYSTTVEPASSRPWRSAPSIIASAIRSFIEPLGFRCSSLTQTSTPLAGARLRSRTSGVLPIASRTEDIRRSLLNIADPTLYLFDGHNLLHAGGFTDLRELRDTLASWVATRGAKGVLVFDGHGPRETHGALEVRFAEHADSVIERLASENRERERVCVVSTDSTLRATAGRMVKTVTSQTFLAEFEPPGHVERKRAPLADRLDEETRARLEQLRRGQ